MLVRPGMTRAAMPTAISSPTGPAPSGPRRHEGGGRPPPRGGHEVGPWRRRRRAGPRGGFEATPKKEPCCSRPVHPAIRIAIGLVVLIAGVTLHKVIFDVAGAVVMIAGAAQWLHKTRR